MGAQHQACAQTRASPSRAPPRLAARPGLGARRGSRSDWVQRLRDPARAGGRAAGSSHAGSNAYTIHRLRHDFPDAVHGVRVLAHAPRVDLLVTGQFDRTHARPGEVRPSTQTVSQQSEEVAVEALGQSSPTWSSVRRPNTRVKAKQTGTQGRPGRISSRHEVTLHYRQVSAAVPRVAEPIQAVRRDRMRRAQAANPSRRPAGHALSPPDTAVEG